MQLFKLSILSIFSGLLLGVSWPATGNLAPLIFVALLPLLYVEDFISQNLDTYKSRHVFGFSFLTFLIFNAFTQWWIWFASPIGMVLATLLNGFYMATVFYGFHATKKNLGQKKGYFALIIYWVGFEWLHSNWELAHPWKTLGNVFSNYPSLIQWYEYTGVFGGSLWILIVAVLLFQILKNTLLLKAPLRKNKLLTSSLLAVIMLPSIYSYVVYANYEEEENPVEVIVLQPNIDPYQKFDNISETEQVNALIKLAQQKITPNTQYIIAPETAIPSGSEESRFEKNEAIITLRKLIETHPNLKFVTGISSHVDYGFSNERPTPTARKYGNPTKWYDAFNTAILIDSSTNIQTYHKSKLVIGVEKMPFPTLLAPLEQFALNLGGTFGSLGTEKEAKNFTHQNQQVAPVICYESVFGDYCASYVQKGAQLFFIITNDGWWGNTPGYQQHLAYARLRAIENRRSIARSANTGTSCFINQRGDLTHATNWWEPAAIRTSLNTNKKQTFYTQHGAVLGRLAAALAVLLILLNWVTQLKKDEQPTNRK